MPHIFGCEATDWLQLTYFEAFGPPVKNFALAYSVVILGGASAVPLFRYLKV